MDRLTPRGGINVCSFIVTYLAALCLCTSAALAYESLSDASLRRIPSAGQDFNTTSGALLSPILIPRVPGTEGWRTVQGHFVDFFSTHLPEWRLEWQNSTSKTPVTGDEEMPFQNLIFTRDPPWASPGDVSRLSLVAHYDSLHQPAGFIGAIDSAAPCAILLHAARSIDAALARKWEDMTASGEAGMEDERGVQVIFMDGEEAWATWTQTDSIYGARSLADAWGRAAYPAPSAHRSPLDAISLFVLLDLLGAPDPYVPSYFESTHWAYARLSAIEDRLRALGLLASKPAASSSSSSSSGGLPFLPEAAKPPGQFRSGYIEDDHIPFLARGVDILHLIPSPFPPVWHTMDDDGAHLDVDTVDDWAKIVTAFAAEWMELDGHLGGGARGERTKDEL